MKAIVKERTITRQIPVEVTESYIEYVANDGKVFDTEEECVRHENKADVDEIFKEIKKADWHDLPLCVDENNAGRFSGDDKFTYYFPRSMEEIEALNTHYNLNGINKLNFVDVRCWVCIDECADEVHVYKLAFSDLVKYTHRMMLEFGYKLKFEFVGDENNGNQKAIRNT